jgi:hypothetical protein
LDGLSRVVVWDVDDVLNDLMRAWLEDAWTSAHPDSHVAYDDLRENPPCSALGISRAAYVRSLDGFRIGERYAALEPNRDILAWLEQHGEQCHHIALTSTAFAAAPTTAAWVLRHFGRWIREFAFIPAPREGERLPVYDSDKGAWLSRLRGRPILVDDSPRNLDAAAAVGADVVCWPRPWNAATTTVAETLGSLTQLLSVRESA